MSKGLTDLKEHLFAQMARLDDPNMTPEQIETEAKRAAAMVSVSDQIISGAKTQIEAAKLYANHGPMILQHLPQVGPTAENNAKKIEQAKT